MIKKLISKLMLLSDSGKLLKQPIKGLYSFLALLSFLPLIAALYYVIDGWDGIMGLLGTGFWANFVSMFVLDLALLALLLFGMVGYHFWVNRRNHLDSVIRTGSRTVAIPLVADMNQSCGEVNSLFLVMVPVTIALLAYIACLLTGGFDIYSDFNFLLWLLAIAVGAAAVLLVAYLNLLLTRFVSERIRLIPQIGNDVQRIAGGTAGTLAEDGDDDTSGFVLPAVSTREKVSVIAAVAGAALCALLFALWISVSVGVNYKKSVFEPLTDSQVEHVEEVYHGFHSLYNDARSMAEEAQESGEEATFRKISYKMLDGYYDSFYNNEDFKEKVRKSAREKFEKEVRSPLQAKIQAEKEKWEKFVEEKDVDRYLKVETVTSYYKESGYYDTYYRPEFYFKVSEPNGKLSDAEVVFVPVNSSGYSHSNASETTLSLSGLKEMNSSSPRHYVRVDDSSFWDKYNMKVTVKSVTVGGKTIKAEDKDRIPQAVKDYLDSQDEYTETVFIKSQIDPEYKDLSEYTEALVQEELRKKNPLCYDFITKFD